MMITWDNNYVQFARLIAELEAGRVLDVNYNATDIEPLLESMDLTAEDLADLVERACTVWDHVKNKTTSSTCYVGGEETHVVTQGVNELSSTVFVNVPGFMPCRLLIRTDSLPERDAEVSVRGYTALSINESDEAEWKFLFEEVVCTPSIEKAPTLSKATAKCLALSTAHMPCSEPDFGPYRTISDENTTVLFIGDVQLGYEPEWLAPILEYAIEHGIGIVTFDNFDDVVEGLPTYNW